LLCCIELPWRIDTAVSVVLVGSFVCMEADMLYSKVTDKELALTNAGALPAMLPVPSLDSRYGCL
jgi:hypothetical protein